MRFLIDGYNLIFSRRRPGRPLRSVNIEAARASLLDLLVRYKAATGDALTVFFDGGAGAKGFMRRQRVRGVDVTFSYPDSTADEEIQDHLETIRNRAGVYVVSSDNSLCAFAKKMGVKVADCPSFLAHVRKTLGRKRTEAEDADPDEKMHGPRAGEVEYWVRVFRQAARKERT